MSIFDQFNANPYIRTYAGAPIQEAMQTASALQMRGEQNLANMDKLQLQINAMPSFGQADEAFKQEFLANTQRQLEEIAKNPEHSSRKVRSAAMEAAVSPALKRMQSTAAAAAKFQEEYGKDPEKYGDVAAWEFQQAMDAYEAGGGAKGSTVFKAPQLIEQMDIAKFMRENGKEIAADQEGIAYVDGKYIYENTQEVVEPSRVKNILMGAAQSDRRLMNQMARQLKMNNAMNPDAPIGLGQELENTVAPFVDMFSYSKETKKMKGAGGRTGSGSGMSMGTNMFDYNGADIKFDMTADNYRTANAFIEKVDELSNSSDPRDVQQGLRMKMNYRNAVQAVADRENFDPAVTDFLMNTDIKDLPHTYRENVGNTIKDGGAIVETRVDRGSWDAYAAERGLTPEQSDKYFQQVDRAMNGSWLQTDLKDTFESSNTLAMDTQFTNVAANLGLTAREESQMNQMFTGSLSGKDKIDVVGEEGEIVSMSGEDFAKDFDLASVRIISMDTNGTGAVNVEIKNNDSGNVESHMIIADPNTDQIFRVMGNAYAFAANDPNNTPSQQMEAARKGLNTVQPQISRSAEMAMSRPGETVPLQFGDFNNAILNVHGQVGIQFTDDGDFVAMKNGTNLFANSPEFTTLAEQANSPQEIGVLVTQYLRQNMQ